MNIQEVSKAINSVSEPIQDLIRTIEDMNIDQLLDRWEKRIKENEGLKELLKKKLDIEIDIWFKSKLVSHMIIEKIRANSKSLADNVNEIKSKNKGRKSIAEYTGIKELRLLITEEEYEEAEMDIWLSLCLIDSIIGYWGLMKSMELTVAAFSKEKYIVRRARKEGEKKLILDAIGIIPIASLPKTVADYISNVVKLAFTKDEDNFIDNYLHEVNSMVLDLHKEIEFLEGIASRIEGILVEFSKSIYDVGKKES